MSDPDKTILETTHEEMRDGFQYQKLESQIADVLGELDAVAQEAEPENRIRALSAKLRHLELRRHHGALLRQEGHVRGEMLAAMNKIADNLNTVVESRFAPPDKTVMEARAMGVHLRMVGDKDDPQFQAAVTQMQVVVEALAAERLRVTRQHLEWEEQDRKGEGGNADPA